MRQAGTLPGEQEAERFADYLLTLGITTKLEKQPNAWAVWVREEERVPQAKEELAAFVSNPADPRYAGAKSQAQTIRREAAAKADQARKNMVELRGRWSTSGGARPLTMILIGLSLLVAMLTSLGEDPNEVYRNLTITDLQEGETGRLALHDGLEEIRHGQIWRLVTPIFLHFGALHLVFGMWMLFRLGGLVEIHRGQMTMAGLVLTSATISNLAQYAMSGANFGGMSGVLYALFGYAWMKSRFDPMANIFLSPETVVILVAWLFYCLTGYAGPVANTAHVAGLIVGMVIGFAPVAWRKWGK